MDLQIHKDEFEGCNCSCYFISFFLIWPVIDHIHLSMCFCNMASRCEISGFESGFLPDGFVAIDSQLIQCIGFTMHGSVQAAGFRIPNYFMGI